MSFEDLVDSQYELGDEIRQFIENCKKTGKDRRTSQFYATKIQRLQQFGDEFFNNNTQLAKFSAAHADDEYFTKAYYDEINKLLVEFTKKLEAQAMELANNAAEGTKDAGVKSEVEATQARLLRKIHAVLKALNDRLEQITREQNDAHPQAYYTIKASILEKHMMDLTEANDKLWEIVDDDQIDNYTLKTYYDMETKVETALIALQQYISNESGSANGSLTRSNDQSAQVHLPKITLPKFNGEYMQWMSFKDLFTEVVHHANISDAQRMQYLTQSLQDEPKNLIRHLPATGNNYASAWNILVSRYDNKRLIVSTLLNKLMSQPAIKNESPAAMKALHDVTKECLHGLKTQGLPTHHWDAIIAHIVLRKMDDPTQTAFEQGIDNCRRLITQNEVLQFLERRFQALEIRNNNEKNSKRTCGAVVDSDGKCIICKKDKHSVNECTVFKNAQIKQKWNYVKVHHLCANCLRPGHQSNSCKSRHCAKCTKKHNTALHPEVNKTPSTTVTTLVAATDEANESQDVSTGNAVSLLMNQPTVEDNLVLLGTAKIVLVGQNGRSVECKAILDSGSQVNLLTERILKKLGVTKMMSQLHIEGVGLKDTSVNHRTVVTLKSKFGNFTTKFGAHIIPKIVSDQPSCRINTEMLKIPKEFSLADPEYHKPSRIDCLIGADIFYDLLTNGKLKLGRNLPTLQNTVLGWVVAGNVGPRNASNAVCGICTTTELENMITKFWKLEEIPETAPSMSEDDMKCESHFLKNTTRSADGRFMVRLPLREHPSNVADTRDLAYYRFKNIERRLSENEGLRDQYAAFLKEYENLGHMTEVNLNKVPKPHYFIPHHCVIRPESTSTKLRVVFDASAHRASSLSLNDIMFTGPTVQSELFSILMRFRTYKYALKTDVEKMYRQIWVHPHDRNLQLIMWRDKPADRVKTYQLNTVTYGTRSAPYLATRCLRQLADDNMQIFPYGAAALKWNFYVDDGLVGANSLREAEEIRRQLITIFESAGMKLKKWCSNTPRLLEGIAPDDQEITLNFDSNEDQSTKTLGLIWLPKSDILGIKANIKKDASITKRTVTSDLAHIYDPLGLVSPVVVTAKIFIQQLWQLKYDWDTNLPNDLQRTWTQFRDDLPAIESTRIPRYIGEDQGEIQLHAFADASERAYGAAIYARIIDKTRAVKAILLCSKSRVAPLKLQTIPKLELCAALIAAELMKRVITDLSHPNKKLFFWSDSQIVLSWINHQPGTLPPFVAHRIIKIREITSPDQWRYVPSKQNPADILSRGLKPRELSNCSLWWYGPLFLYQDQRSWPLPYNDISEMPTIVAISSPKKQPDYWIYSIPSKNKFMFVQRTVGYVLRFIKNTRHPKESRPTSKELSALELDAALKTIVRQIQMNEFSDVMKILQKENFLPKSHHMSSLTPFLDEENVIRVGGRLNSSMQSFDANHQMILPSSDPLVKLLVEKAHKDSYHCGPQALHAQVRQRYWIIKGKNLARAVVQRCVQCTKAKPVFFEQIMGNLPLPRTELVRPFLNTGVDYCGPFWVHYKVRGKRPQKAYLAVFCCFASKAVHLELVTELTTDAFIGALKRFISRRGQCKALYSDNATNFVGAKNQLAELHDIVFSEKAQTSITRACGHKGIEFHFIPPRSPHFGGLWEAAVKSAKHLLLKNMSSATLTYEELETMVTEIEAILNSRPITPDPSDPNDLNAITPGHLLIGDALTSSVDVHAQDTKRSMTHRWKQVSELKHQFWKRWSSEYLNLLQQRHKWKGPITHVPENTMVIIKEDNVPVLQWPLGRIINVHQGDDGIVRVCDVKTQNGIFKRAIHRLAPLFPEDNTSENAQRTIISDPEPEKPVECQTTSPQPSLKISIPLSRLRKAGPTDEMPSSKSSRLQTNLLISLIALFFLPLALSSPINVTKFNTRPGIYFEQIGHLRLSTTNWNIVAYYDLEPYKNELSFLQQGTHTLRNLCGQIESDTSCNALVDYFEETRDTLETKFKLFDVKRVKRGAIDAVGNVAHSLFGILDSNYESRMSETIQQLKGNDEHLEMLLKKQTSVIDSTINIMKQTQKNAEAKFEELENQINNLLVGHALESPHHQIHLATAISTLTVQMFIVVSTLQRTQTSIMEVLIDSHHGKINPLLMTPRQLTNEIIKIKSHLSQHLQLPIDSDNLLQIYKLLTVDGVVAENHVVFTIQLPLSDAREFQVFHLVPVVAVTNNSLVTVKTTINLLAISLHRDDFFSLTDSQLESCMQLSTNSFLCHNIQASYHKPSRTIGCEMELFTNETEPRCELQVIKEATVWNQLRHQNQWMYATVSTIKLNAVCEEETFQLTLNGSGLIQLQPNCIIKNELITIQGHKEMQTSTHTSFSGANLPIISQFSTSSLNNHVNKTIAKQFQPAIKELEALQQQLKSIKEDTLPTQLTTYQHHGIVIGYIVLAMIIIVCIKCSWQRCHQGQRQTVELKPSGNAPTPSPRQQSFKATDC